jgi:tetratricopeptide (TPR) repeat protein
LRLASAREAIELIERSDDPTALPRMISGIVWGLWGPDTLALRRQLTARAVMMAVEAADLMLEFSANRAAYYVAIESGDAGVARAGLRRMQEIAAQLREPRLRWLCTVFEVFEATMEARLDDAEQLSGTVLELGTEIGEPNAFALYAAQLFVNRSCAGRYDEVIPLLEAALADTPDTLAFKLAFAISCGAVGRRDEARAILQEGADAGIENLPPDFLWITNVIGYAVLAIDLEDRAIAAELYPIIEPFGSQVAFSGATSQGYIGAYLGRLASLLGQHDLADAHLQRALEINVSFGWVYHQATTLVDLALSQRRRSGRLDAQGQAWLDDAEAIAADRGLANVIEQVAQIRR